MIVWSVFPLHFVICSIRFTKACLSLCLVSDGSWICLLLVSLQDSLGFFDIRFCTLYSEIPSCIDWIVCLFVSYPCFPKVSHCYLVTSTLCTSESLSWLIIFLLSRIQFLWCHGWCIFLILPFVFHFSSFDLPHRAALDNRMSVMKYSVALVNDRNYSQTHFGPGEWRRSCY